LILEKIHLEKIDVQKMYDVYDKWPKIANDSYNSEIESLDFDNIDHMVFTGMGGSGTIGDFFSAIFSKTNMHVSVVKGYILPKTVDENTLVINTSVSGNTVETISTLNQANELTCKTICFSSGGEMESICNKKNILFEKIEQIHSPRASFLGYVYSILKYLQKFLPISKNEILQSIADLEQTSKLISSTNLTDSNTSLNLANWIKGIPIVYYPAGLEPAAIRFKNSFQENVKFHAMVEDIIEACHNGIVSWETDSNVVPILLQGFDDFSKTKERWLIIKEFFDSKNIDYMEINSLEGSILSKLVNLIYIFDYSTIYSAVLNNKNPSSIEPINFVKKRLNREI